MGVGRKGQGKHSPQWKVQTQLELTGLFYLLSNYPYITVYSYLLTVLETSAYTMSYPRQKKHNS